VEHHRHLHFDRISRAGRDDQAGAVKSTSSQPRTRQIEAGSLLHHDDIRRTIVHARVRR
jgi:hypothetical protein